MSGLSTRLAGVEQRIGAACVRAGRSPEDVTLVAVSKKHPPSAIAEALAEGVTCFGENYVQEWQAKAEHRDLVGRDLEWAFIGHLQRNKVRFLIGRVSLIESVDSPRLAREIGKRAAGLGRTQSVLLQVALHDEDGKGGFTPASLREELPELLTVSGLSIEGLMHIPPPRESAEATRADHRALAALRDELQEATGASLPELSMGMSTDFEVAIEEGATRVRVGTAVFGPRPVAEDRAETC